MTSPRNIIQELNTDALLQIFEHLSPNGRGGLRSLSMTCWAMREATSPVLFNNCSVLVEGPVNEDRFIPRSLWPHIRTLSLIDKCPDLVAMRRSYWSRDLMFTNDRLLCGTMCATFLRDALRAMPLLHSVCLRLSAREVHGIGWDSIAAILSTPQLRNFTIGAFLFSPRQAPPEMWIDTLAPITTFRYDQVYYSYLRTYPTQQDTLAFVLTRLHRSLEHLLLPSEITPVAVLSQTQWPQLRELTLTGEIHQDAGYEAPFVSLLSGMSRLRVLNLALALPKSVDRKQLMLWPEGYDSRLPWPDLEELTVSFPDPADHIYGELPLSLRRLSLRCTPHHCLHLWQADKYPPWHSPILRASEMLDIVTKISTPVLDSLQLEYCADDADDELLRCIADKFSNVQLLEIHRLLTSGDRNVPVANVGRRLATLRSLRTLRVHLHLPPLMLHLSPDTPQEEYRKARFRARVNIAELCQNATILQNELPQSNLGLWLLQREDLGASWTLFRWAVAQGVDQESQMEPDPACGQGVLVYGLE